MPFPIAHGLAGASIVEATTQDFSLGRSWKPLAVGAAIAILPDFDYLLVWALDFDESWHRGFSHSIIFGVFVGLLASAVMDASRIREALGYIFAAVSHGLLDFSTTKYSKGVQLFWPFSVDWFKLGLFDYPVHNLFITGMIELSGILVLLLIILWGRQNRSGNSRQKRERTRKAQVYE
jgi:membrane-bound metal-dependent hydrolase YbcI (DUF457 family)